MIARLGDKRVKSAYLKASRLPEEYQEVEYIESTGNQYINTQKKPSVNYTIRCKGMFIGENSTTRRLFGAINYGYKSIQPILVGDNKDTVIVDLTVGAQSVYIDTQFKINEILEVEVKPTSYVKLNNQQYSYNNNLSTNETNIALFGSMYARNIRCDNRGPMRIYSFQMYDDVNDEYVIDLIPCYRKADNEIGMYDVVNDVFYTRAAGTVFIKGNDVEGSGNTQILSLYIKEN